MVVVVVVVVTALELFFFPFSRRSLSPSPSLFTRLYRRAVDEHARTLMLTLSPFDRLIIHFFSLSGSVP